MYQDSNLYGWLFTYNHFIGKWCAFKSEHLAEYFNNIDSENILRAEEMDVLQALIGRYGTVEKINASFEKNFKHRFTSGLEV